jgi:hypothetical protein
LQKHKELYDYLRQSEPYLQKGGYVIKDDRIDMPHDNRLTKSGEEYLHDTGKDILGKETWNWKCKDEIYKGGIGVIMWHSA